MEVLLDCVKIYGDTPIYALINLKDNEVSIIMAEAFELTYHDGFPMDMRVGDIDFCDMGLYY